VEVSGNTTTLAPGVGGLRAGGVQVGSGQLTLNGTTVADNRARGDVGGGTGVS
jgi:hypothetical protein